ncbi:hypothetical protein SALBM135S_08765 [Streptomyces alboniger]
MPSPTTIRSSWGASASADRAASPKARATGAGRAAEAGPVVAEAASSRRVAAPVTRSRTWAVPAPSARS